MRVGLRSVALFVAVALTLLASGCFLGFPSPDIWIDARYWYNNQEVLIPFEVRGDGNVAYARYRFEYNNGSGWELDEEREIQLPSGSSGVLQYWAPDPSWDYRLTFAVLRTRDASAVPTPFMTEVQIFRIDFAPPGGGFNPGTELNPVPPGPYPQANMLETLVTNNAYFNDGGSPVRLVYTTDGSVPTEWDRSVWGTGDWIHIWDPGQVGVGGFVLLRMMFIDDAGNRSGVFWANYNGS